MRRILRGAAALALATAALTAVGTTEAQAADEWAGCPYGAVCVYPQNQNPAVSPSHIYWTYGTHNLQNQYGNHWVLNNQYDGALALLCYSSGTDCTADMLAEGTGVYADLTPINSIVLRPHLD
jgi:hypothetical protein